MVRSLVLRGAGAGAVAGLVAFVYALVVAEPLVSAAIDYEGAREEASDALRGIVPAEEGPDLVDRGVQSTLGIGVGLVALGIAFGVLLALAFALFLGRSGRLRPRALGLLLAAGGFVTLYAVPFLKYPANPPAVSADDTIGDRTGLYLIMVVASVAVAVLAAVLGRRLAARAGTFTAALLAGGAFVVVMTAVGLLLPALGELTANVVANGPRATETPGPLLDGSGSIAFPGFDPDLLYDFRLASVVTQGILWAVLGAIFAPMAELVVAPPSTTPPGTPSSTPSRSGASPAADTAGVA